MKKRLLPMPEDPGSNLDPFLKRFDCLVNSYLLSTEYGIINSLAAAQMIKRLLPTSEDPSSNLPR